GRGARRVRRRRGRLGPSVHLQAGVRARMKSGVLIVALLASGLSAGAEAQGTRVGALAPGERIDDARARLRDESLSGAERLDALRDLMAALDARGAMAGVPAETRARDAVELAESALTASAWEGVQATASVGVLTPSMREAARAHATRALDAITVYARHGNGERANDDALALRATLARARAGALLRAATNDEPSR